MTGAPGGAMSRLLSREQIRALLVELGADLADQGLRGDIFLVGGAAMALAYNTRRLTADVDGVFEPKAAIYAAGRRVATRHPGLPEDWLNDGVKAFLPGNDAAATVVLDEPGIRVQVASAAYLLALKVLAARVERDRDDILLLARACEAITARQVLEIAERVLGGPDRLAPKARYIVEELFPHA